MKKIVIITITVISVIALAIFSGVYLYKMNNVQEEAEVPTPIVSEKNENLVIIKNAVEANSKQEKITPTTNFTLKKYYKDCGHTINTYVMLPQELINMTEEELKDEYKDWEVEQFSAQDVTLLKEETGFCNQHYILREKDGIVAVYSIDRQGNETLKEETGISTMYLPQGDLLNIQNGITVYGDEELNKTLEDYE